ncbi:hypothetical protein, partial [Sphingomonas sp.]|uniref:hypothetical protein n=1 Tax=Sphingomonas sp. TaxID=28214 RepID=UPI0025D2AA9E
MSGYREHSFDPYAGERPNGPPSWPFDAVQWAGVVLILVAIAVDVLYVGSAFGWWRKFIDTPVFGITPLMFGIIAINSRRQPVADPAPELADARRKWMIIVISI